MAEFWRIFVVTLFIGAIVWIFAVATAFNFEQADKCEDIGMTWVKEAPWGDYGCAVIVPVPEGE